MSWLADDRGTNLALWVVVWGVLLGWQAFTALRRPADSFATVVRLARHHWSTRWLLVAGWAWLGWHLFVRTTPT